MSHVEPPVKPPRPRLVLSRCLELDACRYNAVSIPAPLVRVIEPHVELVPVCPEVEVGLGVPRDPIRLVSVGGRKRLVQPSTGRDLSEAMRAFAEAFLERVGEVDGFLLKARSPSCGPDDVKLFDDADAVEPVGSTAGMFAALARARFPDAVIEHEVRLARPDVLDAFLRRLFARARERTGAPAPGPSEPYPAELRGAVARAREARSP